MRGITTPVTKIRRQVFTEIARLAYEDGDYSRIEELPYTIIPGEKANYRDSVFKERAIVGERLRLAVGLPLRPVDQHAPVSQGINDSAIADMFYEPPLINVNLLCVQRLRGNQLHRHRPVQKLYRTSMYSRLSGQGSFYRERQILHRQEQMCQVRTMRTGLPIFRHCQE